MFQDHLILMSAHLELFSLLLCQSLFKHTCSFSFRRQIDMSIINSCLPWLWYFCNRLNVFLKGFQYHYILLSTLLSYFHYFNFFIGSKDGVWVSGDISNCSIFCLLSHKSINKARISYSPWANIFDKGLVSVWGWCLTFVIVNTFLTHFY